MKGSFRTTARKMTYFPLSLGRFNITMMLGMAQLQRKQPFWGLSMAVYEYTTSALCPENSLDGRVFFWFHSIVCGLLCGITSSPLLIINSHFQANIYQRLFSMRLIFFSNIASVYKCMLQKGGTTGATLFRNSYLSYLTLGRYYHWLKVCILIHFMESSSEVCVGCLETRKMLPTFLMP